MSCSRFSAASVHIKPAAIIIIVQTLWLYQSVRAAFSDRDARMHQKISFSSRVYILGFTIFPLYQIEKCRVFTSSFLYLSCVDSELHALAFHSSHFLKRSPFYGINRSLGPRYYMIYLWTRPHTRHKSFLVGLKITSYGRTDLWKNGWKNNRRTDRRTDGRKHPLIESRHVEPTDIGYKF